MIANLPVQISAEHLSRQAVVYVRQSSPSQVREHQESTRVQRDLRERAIAFGWRHPVVIDRDLGISAAGYSDRPGFQQLLGLVATRKVGLILCIDASRLSRNSKDWAQLFELCAHFGTLIGDFDQVYDLAQPNDRLIMGIKGTMSEIELTILRRRMQSGKESKAARGELRTNLPAGYVYDDSEIVFDPDQRVQSAIRLMFEQFDQSTSVRQLSMWYKDNKVAFPVKGVGRDAPTTWQIPTSKTLSKLLKHAIYAGTYSHGRRTTVVEYVDGKLVKRETEPCPVEEARHCIHSHHPAYISWKRFLANRAKIGKNHVRWAMQQNPGAAREGLALLSGLLRCGQCGGKIYVSYKPKSAFYYCDGGHEKGSKRCVCFGAHQIDQRVTEELCRALQPLAVDAALVAARDVERHESERMENARLEVEAAQYAADRAFQQFEQCDPRNRLVADTLEKRLDDRLGDLQRSKQRLENSNAEARRLTDEQERQLRELAEDFPAVWNHPKAEAKLRKRIIRASIREIMVKALDETNELQVTVHWQGGAHTRFDIQRRARAGSTMSNSSLEELVRKLAPTLADGETARTLNMKKLTTPGGLRWTQDRVKEYRRLHRIRLEDTNTDDTMTMNQAIEYLGVGHNGILALVRRGAIHKNQITEFAPWRVSRAELDSEPVQRLLATLKKIGRLPKGGWPENQPRLFDAGKGLASEMERGAS